MEETRRRNEASIARKRANNNALNPAAATPSSNSSESPLSPSSTGAMDSLLEKLRAAAPQARDQRDRRRRARLKDKHQVRIASGQTMLDLGDLTKKDGEGGENADGTLIASENGTATDKMEPISEGEDVAERAASMLQGLRDNSNHHNSSANGEVEGSSHSRPASRDGMNGSLRVRRRRESVDDERRHRRRRRARESKDGSVDEDANRSVTGNEANGGVIDEKEEGLDEKGEQVPKTLVSPPSPDGGASKPIVVSDN